MSTQDDRSNDEPENDEPGNEDGQPLRAGWQGAPMAERFDPDHASYNLCLAAHEQAMAKGSLGYLDPASGLFVMTAQYLRNRGWCCDRGCRHCPYEGRPTDGRPPSTGVAKT